MVFEGTRAEVAGAAESFFAEAEADDTLVFYYSGHGRRALGELVLCCQDTVTSRPMTTGLGSEALNRIIGASSAKTVVVILDCCFSGSFKKGEEAIERDLSGSGRYVIAATSGVEEADDAERAGLASPFTAALVAGLRGGAVDANGDGKVDLDDLFEYVKAATPSTAPRPRQSFHGTGNIAIANARIAIPLSETSVGFNEGERAADVSTTVDREHTTPVADGVRGDLARIGLDSHRKRNDFSYGDLAIWRFYILLAITSLACSTVAGFQLASGYDQFGIQINSYSAVLICRIAAGISGAMVFASIAEWLTTRRILRNATSRRMALIGFGSNRVRIVQALRDLTVLAAAILFMTQLPGGYADPAFSVMLACFAATTVMSAATRLKLGDAAYLAGAVIVFGVLFVPYPISSYGMQNGVSGVALVQFICALGMMLAWWKLVSSEILTLVSLSCSIPIGIMALGRISDALWVTVAGAGLALVAGVLGDGTPIDGDSMLTRASLFRLIGRHSNPSRSRERAEA